MPPLQPPETPFPDFPITISPPPQPPSPHHHFHPRQPSSLLPPILAATIALAFFLVFAIMYRKLSNKRTAPVDLKQPPQQPHRFSYSVLRRATASFSADNRLGQGGFGSVYRGILPSGQEVAVKLMDASGSLQGEREFHNELSLASKIDTACCPHVVSILGFSCDDHNSRHHYSGRQKRGRFVIVYEYMHNGNLQDALIDRKCPELILWKKRFSIILGVAKGIEYLHHSCDPPIVHGDIKPSNVLLDSNFEAKIADFGLAQVLSKDENEIVETFIEDEEKIEEGKKGGGFENGDDNGSIIQENESVMTEEVVVNVDQSPESCCVRILDREMGRLSPELGAVEASPSEGLDNKTCTSEGFDRVSVDSGNRRATERRKSESGRDWWWKQDNVNGGSDSGRIKDYVMEWLGNEIKKHRHKKDWIATPSSVEEGGAKVEPKKHRKKLQWWASLNEEKVRKDRKNRKPREWWKEEFCEELTKKKKKRELKPENRGELWCQRDEDVVPERKKRKSRGSRSSIDWWLDGFSFSGEFLIGRRNSQDWATGDVPRGGGISSTPSMRGTVCYIAPEFSGGAQLSEKCDVYSYGVLLLVLVSGRRPLQVTASPISEFERANLISWARQLAHSGRLLDIVDTNIQSLDREQSLLCITIALLCLQRSPNKRPTMKEIVGMLSGESEPPHLPFEFSLSPSSNFPFKSRKKPR